MWRWVDISEKKISRDKAGMGIQLEDLSRDHNCIGPHATHYSKACSSKWINCIFTAFLRMSSVL